MIRLLSGISALALLAACATTMDGVDASDFIAAIPLEESTDLPAVIVETSVPLPLPGQMRPLETADAKADQSPVEAIREGRAQALIEPSTQGYVNAIQVYPYTEGALYRLYASPGQVTDIALQPGEALVSVSAGDTVRWVVGDTISGSGASARAHVLVKPISGGIRTNLMIATDRRTYHLELEAVTSGYMAALSWRYPADELAGLTARNAQAIARESSSIERGLTLERLNFDYRLSGDTPDWTPVRVFDDGRQVYIQMPASIATTDMPPLFVLGERGEAELVNYWVRGDYYVVSRLFRAAELRLGERRQVVVRITRVQRRGAAAGGFGG
ncbi:MAG: P-type conjugative transfer protein TrbG [Hyphomonas sp. 34-62-18]|nr:P-type conjugative transfer protein TrbG [Hyphomonas sp. 34-62-18]OZB19110.1 MAG: P-type conjugative transfer protein TrbG [Hyphomonas sp. 34-62-18]